MYEHAAVNLVLEEEQGLYYVTERWRNGCIPALPPLPFPPREGWGLGTRLGTCLTVGCIGQINLLVPKSRLVPSEAAVVDQLEEQLMR